LAHFIAGLRFAGGAASLQILIPKWPLIAAGGKGKQAKFTLADFHKNNGLEYQRRALAPVNSKESRALEAGASQHCP